MDQKPAKSPTGFEDNLPVLLGTLQMSGKDVSVVSVKIAQMVSKTATRKLNIVV